MGDVGVSSFWHGGALPTYSRLCFASFIAKGIPVDLYSYGRFDVPRGVRLRDARKVLPEERIFYYRTDPGRGSVSAFSNLFRYKLLMEKGGWWIDADVLCLQPSLPAEDFVFAWQEDAVLGNAVMKLPPNHPFGVRLYEAAETLVRERGDALVWGEIGPHLLTRIVNEAGLRHLARPAADFYPLQFFEFELANDPAALNEVLRRSADSICFHLWGEMLRRSGFAATAAPAPGSYLASMLAKHGVIEGQASRSRRPIAALADRLRRHFIPNDS